MKTIQYLHLLVNSAIRYARRNALLFLSVRQRYSKNIACIVENVRKSAHSKPLKGGSYDTKGKTFLSDSISYR